MLRILVKYFAETLGVIPGQLNFAYIYIKYAQSNSIYKR